MDLKINYFVGVYGCDSDMHGVLSDHVARLEEAGGVVNDDGLAFFPGEQVHMPVVCSEVIKTYSEDGTGTGRCGMPIQKGTPWCRSHQMAEPEDLGKTCEHGMAAWLCAGPGHYPLDLD